MNFRPNSTYRIQFHKNFNLDDFSKIIPYLHALGVDTIYASPIFMAVKGSMHGYDVTNPLQINPEIGTEKQLVVVSEQLKKYGMGWIQDIVPNHMAFHPENHWLMDVLQNGKASAYSDYFDIRFKGSEPLMVPFLGESLDEAIDHGEVILKQKDNSWYLKAAGNYWPLNAEAQKILKKNGVPPSGLDHTLLQQIINSQHYRLCSYEETNQEINYRRFFTVNSLICMNMQHKKVFDTCHSYIIELVKRDVFQGLRIDHIDGLMDPEGYLKRLRKSLGSEPYIIVEKILQRGEELPETWPVQGATGYEFIAAINNLFTNCAAEQVMEKTYEAFTGKSHYADLLLPDKKRLVLNEFMGGERRNLCELFKSLGLAQYTGPGEEEVEELISNLLIYFPVYRLYEYTFPLREDTKAGVSAWLDQLEGNSQTKKASLQMRTLLLSLPEKKQGKYNLKLGQFFQRLMQFTGPLMAKGVEDTLMFTYNRFTVHNEVGDDAAAFGMTVAAFHEYMQSRQQHWPHALNASTTHDTKRGEDVRARLNALSQSPARWDTFVNALKAEISASTALKSLADEVHRNDLYLLLQTIIGTAPYENLGKDHFISRLEEYIPKVIREGKKRSDWSRPDEEYETKVFKLIKGLLTGETATVTLIRDLIKELSGVSVVNSLAQHILKFTCPGIPDIYQGSELWELSMVDPDNRRAVDYKQRIKLLEKASHLSFHELIAHATAPDVKLKLTQVLLKLRQRLPDLFAAGSYVPLRVSGRFAGEILAFARNLGSQWIITVVPLATVMQHDKEGYVKISNWEDTAVILPDHCPLSWTEILSGHSGYVELPETGILINDLFEVMPLALVELKPKKHPAHAGILAHISSLPSGFAIGSLGAEAHRFVHFLQQAGQRYWQLLPVSPVDQGTFYSPYSSVSSSAGNVLFISGEKLFERGLIAEADLVSFEQGAVGPVDYELAEKQSAQWLRTSYENRSDADAEIETEFKRFMESEKDWLDEFALFEVLKSKFGQSNWSKWPDRFKNRETEALNEFQGQHTRDIEFVKWQQYLFFAQWEELKVYANGRGIQLVGDLPFYPDYNSHEVWANPGFFMLDEDLQPLAVAGVPPDYFNEKGQLWGMPLFNWDKMSKDGYRWWQKRIMRQLERFDVLRLDHFRAFCEYWSVPAGEKTAINGEWKKGPGEAFFKLLFRKDEQLALIAEDLGDPSDAVDELLERFNLAGMKVLQFGFGPGHQVSVHIPHGFERRNCVAYTGTHDNNTTKGWFETETGGEIRQQLNGYASVGIDENSISPYMCRLAYSSIAKTVIIPMQDFLGLGAGSRMNVPGKAGGNWSWRMDATDISDELIHEIRLLTAQYGRLPEDKGFNN